MYRVDNKTTVVIVGRSKIYVTNPQFLRKINSKIFHSELTGVVCPLVLVIEGQFRMVIDVYTR